MNGSQVSGPLPGTGSAPERQVVDFGSLVPVPLHTLHPCQGQVVVLVDEPYVDRVDRGVAVILGTGDDMITAFVDGQVRRVLPGERVVEITDPRTVLAVNRQALDHLAAATGRIHDATTDAAAARRSYHAHLAQIRAYAIAHHRRGDIRRSGLENFLQHFDLDAYQPRHVVVTFTVSGSFELIPGADRDLTDTEREVREQLLIDTGQITGVSAGTVECRIEVSAAEASDE